MRLRTFFLVVTAALGCWGLLHAQKPFKEYETVEGHAESDIPPDYSVPHEWTRGRLMYPDYTGFLVRDRRRGSWTIDYPRSDRHLLFGVKRLTRIDTRSVEQSVALDNSDDIYNWPMMYAASSSLNSQWPTSTGIYDDKGRIVVAICHNMDLGDAWEWSDDPRYPAEWANMAYRIAMNYFIYDLSH